MSDRRQRFGHFLRRQQQTNDFGVSPHPNERMSGIDKSLIVGMDNEILDELVCGICHDIFVNPVVTPCCRQTFCNQCINQWLKQQNICPNDRKALNWDNLMPAPRALVNIVNHLRVKCDHHINGCQSVVKLSEKERHSRDCSYNKFNIRNTSHHSKGPIPYSKPNTRQQQRLLLAQQSPNIESQPIQVTQSSALFQQNSQLMVPQTNVRPLERHIVGQQIQHSNLPTGVPNNTQRYSAQQALQRLVSSLRSPATPQQKQRVLSILKSNPAIMAAFIRQRTAQRQRQQMQTQTQHKSITLPLI